MTAPAQPRAIPQMEPTYGREEIDAMTAYLESRGWLTEFTQTRAFERAIADYVGARHCTVVPSGTAALFVSLTAAGMGPGHEVLVPDLTMIATATAVTLAGARPVFVDIDARTHCLDLARAEHAVTPHTRAMLVVSLNGRSPDMTAAREICDRRGILLLEDAAQSLGSRSNGRHLGTFGQAGILSFSAPKIITTGQGGAVLTDDDEIAARAERVKDFGRAVPGVDRHESIGFNFKFTDVQAVIGLAQMAKLPARVERKKAMYARYASLLGEIPEVSLVPTDLQQTAPWFMDVYVDDPQGLRAHLAASGIGSRPVYPAIHSQPAFDQGGHFPESERVARTGLWLPSSVRVTDEEIGRVCGCVAEFFGRTARS